MRQSGRMLYIVLLLNINCDGNVAMGQKSINEKMLDLQVFWNVIFTFSLIISTYYM